MAKPRVTRGGGSNGLSRRAFLSTGAGLAAAAPALTGMGLPAPAGAAAAVPILGPDKAPITLSVNGKAHTLSVEPRTTLFEAIHDHLDLTGTKNVCDRATCGACTVMIDGRTVYSCAMLAIEAQGRKIVTVEGLSEGALSPIQKAFVEHDGLQCGFCTPGFVVSCKAFLDRNPNPTMEQVERGLGGNLCRCGTYVGIRKAVLSAAQAGKGGGSHA